MAVTAAISGYAATIQVSDAASPAVHTAIAEAVKISGFGIERTVIEATNLTSPQQFKEFIYGMKESKEFGVEANYLPTDTSQKGAITGSLGTSISRAWRFVLPDFGAVTKTISGITTSTWTCSASHGWLTPQPVIVTSTGSMPGGINIGQVYWARRVLTTTVKLYLSPDDATADSGAITPGSSGSGTITMKGTSIWSFTGECMGFTADADADAKLVGQLKFKITGASTLTP